VLGIISGSLGIPMGILAIYSVSALQAVASALRIDEGSMTLAVILGYLQAFGTFGAAVALLTGGIMFLKGKGYNVLLYAAYAQAGLVLIQMITTVLNRSINSNAGVYFIIMVGAGLAGFTIARLLTPAAKQWRQ